MIFLDFGTEFVNLSQVYQIDLRDTPDGTAVSLVFFYHLAGTTSGGYKVSKPFMDKDAALDALVSLGIDRRPVKLEWQPK
jgi:hypothetical protein